jgi:hypothetical protein
VAEVYVGDLMGPEPEAPEPEPDAEGPSLTAEQLGEYAGSYRSPELDSTFDLEVDAGGRLVASHWRNDPSVLAPTGADTFRGDQWFLPEVRFVRDGAGRVSAFTVTGVRVRDLIFERRP